MSEQLRPNQSCFERIRSQIHEWRRIVYTFLTFTGFAGLLIVANGLTPDQQREPFNLSTLTKTPDKVLVNPTATPPQELESVTRTVEPTLATQTP